MSGSTKAHIYDAKSLKLSVKSLHAVVAAGFTVLKQEK